jgi:type II secretory pathway pseudopilin PulG
MTQSSKQSAHARRLPRSERGFSLLEVVLAVVALALIGGPVARSVVLSASGRDSAEYLATATEAARGMADRIEATPFDELVARFGTDGVDGPTFDVYGLPGQDQGVITLVIDETSKDADIGMSLGMPRDLDGDGKAETTDVSGSARVIPVIVAVTWTGRGQSEQTLRLPVVVVRGN